MHTTAAVADDLRRLAQHLCALFARRIFALYHTPSVRGDIPWTKNNIPLVRSLKEIDRVSQNVFTAFCSMLWF